MGKNIQKILVGLVIVIVLAVIFMRGDQLEKLVETVRQGTPLFLILAVMFQIGKYLLQGVQFIWCFRSVGSTLTYLEGIKLVFGTFFVNTVAPSLNLAGTTLVVDDAAKRGVPAGKATGAALLMQLSIDSGFLMIMIIVFTTMSLTVGLQPGWILLGVVAAALVGGLLSVMVVGGTKPQLLLKVLHPVERLIDKISRKLRKKPVDAWVDRTVEAFSGAAASMAKRPTVTARAFLFALLVSTCELTCFVMTGLAFGVHNIHPLICGYVVATLAAMVAVTPQGVGIVEAAVLLAFTLFGEDQATGMAVVLVYRAIVFWLPFLVGAIMIQRTKAFKNAGVKTKQEAKMEDAGVAMQVGASQERPESSEPHASEGEVSSSSPREQLQEEAKEAKEEEKALSSASLSDR